MYTKFMITPGRKPHKTNQKSQIITANEWTEVLGISRQTFYNWLEEYEKAGNSYNSKDILSILKLHKYLLEKE